MAHKYKFVFSFVIPVYNVAGYLPETVESVIKQTFDFEKYVEIIFVNDGSPDNVEDICLMYKEKYPNNIKYIKQKNAGLSAARNRGLKEIEGKYVSFLDSDDKISKNTLSEVYKFFESHYDEVDFVTMRVNFFEAKTGGHPLNYAIKDDRVVDVDKDWQDLHIQIASCFLKQEVFGERGYEFNPLIRRFAEDVELLGRLILDTMKFGTVSKPIYHYRKRSSGGSIIDSSLTAQDWYEITPVLVFQRLFDYANDKLGYIPKHIQYMVMYDLEWRLRQKTLPDFPDEFISIYKQRLVGLFKQIDDDVIFAQRYIEFGLKLHTLKLKYDTDDLSTYIGVDEGFLTVKGRPVLDLSVDYFNTYLTIINKDKDTIVVEGMFDDIPTELITQSILIDGKSAKLQPTRLTRHLSMLSERVYSMKPFKFTVNLHQVKNIKFVLKAGDTALTMPVITRKQTRLNYENNYSYRLFGKYVMRRKYKALLVERYYPLKRPLFELLCQLSLLKHQAVRSLLIRILYFSFLPVYAHKDIWIVSDRVNAAGDNGEALFRYVSSIDKPRNRRVIFAVSGNSTDFIRMKQYGEVIDRYSLRYKILFLFSTKIISSHADDFVINPYGKKEHNISDLYRFDFVFLQHGITKDDQTAWLNKINKNIKLFVTAAHAEYDSILDNAYGYDKDSVQLTGFPRFDLLEDKQNNKLILAPTWRQELIDDADVRGIRLYNQDFKASAYYIFYQNLIKDSRINQALEDKGMTGEFYLHPSLEPQIGDFEGAQNFIIKDFPYDYRTAFSVGTILVSDYSSVTFDFAYLKKPIVYTQYDNDTFYNKHLYNKGYFDYEHHGFGPVAYDYETAVELIIEAIHIQKMDKKYLRQVEKFYYKFDKENSARVYCVIEALNN